MGWVVHSFSTSRRARQWDLCGLWVEGMRAYNVISREQSDRGNLLTHHLSHSPKETKETYDGQKRQERQKRLKISRYQQKGPSHPFRPHRPLRPYHTCYTTGRAPPLTTSFRAKRGNLQRCCPSIHFSYVIGWMDQITLSCSVMR